MLRLATVLVKPTLSGKAKSFAEKPFRVFLINQTSRRWVMQPSAASLDTESKKKITPLGWLLLLIPATTFGLGCWQVKRKAWKEQLIKDLEEKTKATAVPLPKNFAELSQMEYRLITVRGKFLHDQEVYMGPRSLLRPDGSETAGGLISQRDSGNGYLIITPFKLADRDEIILINRGWVSRTQLEATKRPAGQIEGEVEVTGVLRNGESKPRFAPDHNSKVFLYRDLPTMCAVTGAYPIFLDATSNSTVQGGPIGGQTRITLHNDHFSYFVTWFSLSAATSLLWYRQIVRRKPF